MDEEEVSVPLADEPIGDVVARIHDADPEIAALVSLPRYQVALAGPPPPSEPRERRRRFMDESLPA